MSPLSGLHKTGLLLARPAKRSKDNNVTKKKKERKREGTTIGIIIQTDTAKPKTVRLIIGLAKSSMLFWITMLSIACPV